MRDMIQYWFDIEFVIEIDHNPVDNLVNSLTPGKSN